MATGTILLSIPPQGVDATNPPGMLWENDQWVLLFDESTDELCYWSYRMPENYSDSAAPILKVRYKMDQSTSGEVVVRCAIRATADGQNPATETYDSENVSTATTVPATAEQEDEISLTLTNRDSVAAGESFTIRFGRDADNAGDDATPAGDMKVVALSLEFTTT